MFGRELAAEAWRVPCVYDEPRKSGRPQGAESPMGGPINRLFRCAPILVLEPTIVGKRAEPSSGRLMIRYLMIGIDAFVGAANENPRLFSYI